METASTEKYTSPEITRNSRSKHLQVLEDKDGTSVTLCNAQKNQRNEWKSEFIQLTSRAVHGLATHLNLAESKR